ncbi:EthD domain-containing protein [Allorhizobium sp. BGMRC 0089]|uniref:EthD domain-containing protein n=1 Tax=Allorhizobium sonneratiae TaxID=2934936 RepID=UPI002033E60B|nr:EthD domain-containing protein [Allorhizobium sonneratiae]MCM2292680.1 EthD domain-containing protein [Allorhizobium sonneratiae]
MVKMMIFGRRRLGQTLGEHRSHMKDRHGAMVLDYIGREPEQAPRRYVQNHAFDGLYFGGDLPKAFAYGLDFVTEVSFPDLAAAKSSLETPFYLEKLEPDEPQMVDETSVVKVPVNEDMIVPPQAQAGLMKLFLIWFSGRPGAAILPQAAGSTLLGLCHNSAMFPGPLQAIDEAWFGDEASALAAAAACREIIDQTAAAGRYCIALAREFVLHAG